MIADPPYGKDWKRDQDAVRDEHDQGVAGHFGPGLPRISNGRLLFLLHMLAHVRSRAEGGSRVAIIMNGSPLFTGDAGQRRERDWILENDRFSPACASATPRPKSAAIGPVVRSPTRSCAARKRASARGRRVVLRARGEALVPRRLDRRPSR